MGKGIKMTTTSFVIDINKGKIGEKIFIEDFLEFLKINYQDVTDVQGFRIIDSDFLAKIGLYEIKANYKDDKKIIIEDFTNNNLNLGKISLGWFYKSKADVIVFISKNTRAMILLPFTAEFKKHYETIKNNFLLENNRISEHNGNKWQSAFRRISLETINGYFAYYKKVV